MTDYIILIGLLLLIIYWEKICGVVKSLANGIKKSLREMDPKVKKVLLAVGIGLLVAAGVITVFNSYVADDLKILGFLMGVPTAAGVAAAIYGALE